MNRMTRTFDAFGNMMRHVARDPLWAIVALIAAPFRYWKMVARAAVYLMIVLFAAVVARDYLLRLAGSVTHDALWYLGNIVLTLFAFAFMFRVISEPLILHFGSSDNATHGSARLANARDIAPLIKAPSGLLIGRDPRTGKLLRYDGPAHLLTMAPTRSGKGVGTIIPNLLTADRSVICIDPKGENAMVTGRARERFGPVHVLDPFGVTGRPSSTFNPLDQIDPDSVDVAEDASTLADALVFDEPGLSGEAHWNEEAKALIAGLILHIVINEPLARRTLATLRDSLTLDPGAFEGLLKTMQASASVRPAGNLVVRAANRHLAKSDREAAGVLSSAQRHTHFLDSPRMTAVLARSDVRFADLKAGHATVFLVLPPDRLSAYSRWLRLLVTQSLTDMARDRKKPDVPVLYLLDEFASLGYLAPVSQAMGLMAGYGVQLWPILQDIHQLRATYEKRAGTFLSNAGVLQVFGVNDHDSARLISDLLGQETVVFQTMGRNLDASDPGISLSQQHTGRALMTPDEVRNLPNSVELLFLAGQRPIVARKLVYHSDPEFAGAFDPA
ncbi:type IV secretory system conjugative DNA transfer family protein [Rhizobium sp. DKSPLA3]|uniref:Type IV secretory system conjugative DNA transfer family protein n=1 Tax=Rhizobium quercicola TaxID=2901226 RepID=A0A9X1NRH2_9HYPH|nr:type IV secretory system conjugative DNA transfer family protein [Rhizobium quercicola]MCD7109642.1 type IV secretory system conjugative DNA transfer family protein [Rhizobium quercicola]